MLKQTIRCGFVIVLAAALAGASVRAKEPANLYPLKQEIRAYIASGEYDHEIAAVAAEATAWIEQRAKHGGGRLAVVLDLDETLLSNWPLISELDFGYVPEKWLAWTAAGKAPAIVPVAELFRAVRRLGVDVIILTGRQERERPGTEKNLKAIGCADYAVMVFKPDQPPVTTGEFKLAERRRLAAEGWVIIANVGDQESDFLGGVAERTFKLPDPLYVTK